VATISKICYNTSFHHSTRINLFEAIYGYLPPRLLTYMMGTTQLATVETQFHSCDEILKLLLENIHKSHNWMKKYADLKRTEHHFK
jgi:hypothetical protein